MFFREIVFIQNEDGLLECIFLNCIIFMFTLLIFFGILSLSVSLEYIGNKLKYCIVTGN